MGLQLLIVDDSSIVRKVIVRTLGLTDIPVGSILEASNGAEALDALKNNWVDLVFLDINMPVMNGMEFMEKLRADDVLGQTPVVVVSTEGSKERIERLSQLGVKAYLRKPVTAETLVDCVSRVLPQLPARD